MCLSLDLATAGKLSAVLGASGSSDISMPFTPRVHFYSSWLKAISKVHPLWGTSTETFSPALWRNFLKS